MQRRARHVLPRRHRIPRRLTEYQTFLMPETPSTPVPVTLLSGFLGSGKTTLLNRLLEGLSDQRIAVLVNDFGDLNVDADLVVQQDADVLRIQGGCICCTMQGSIVSTLSYLLGRDAPPQHIIIEASGISDPVPIAVQLMMPGLQKHLRLESVLTVIDADRAPYGNQADVQELVESQIKTANIVLLNKADLVDADRLEQLRGWIKDYTPGARILETVHANAPLPLIVDQQIDLDALELGHAHDHEHHGEHSHDDDHSHEHGHRHEHDHESTFRRWSYRSDVPFTTPDDVRRGLSELPDSILRVKGFIATEATLEQRMLLQMAGRRMAFTDHGTWPEAPHTALAILGVPDGPSNAEVQSILNARLAGPAAFTQ
jgi:G3E family GTPase